MNFFIFSERPDPPKIGVYLYMGTNWGIAIFCAFIFSFLGCHTRAPIGEDAQTVITTSAPSPSVPKIEPTHTYSGQPCVHADLEPSGELTSGHFSFSPQTFWDPQYFGNIYSSAQSQQLTQLLQNMPSYLKTTSTLPPQESAERLQWAIHVGNTLGVNADEVIIRIPACFYDFAKLTTHLDTPISPSILSALQPKIYIKTSHLILLGNPQNNLNPIFGFSTTSVNTDPRIKGHARVLIMTDDTAEDFKISNIEIHGNKSQSDIFKSHYYSHENNAVLIDLAKRGIQPSAPLHHALVMIGYRGSPTPHLGATLDHVIFKKINHQAIESIHSIKITHSQFLGSGVTPSPQIKPNAEFMNRHACFSRPLSPASVCADLAGVPFYSPSQTLEYAFGDINPGMRWNVGLSQFGSARTIELELKNNFVSGLTEGLICTNCKGILDNNRFEKITDHAFYGLGTIRNLTLQFNQFSQIIGHAIKMGGHGDPNQTPEDQKQSGATPGFGLGLFESKISKNRFENIHGPAISMTGSYNEISENQITPYQLNNDPTQGWYNPTWKILVKGKETPDRLPRIWLGSYGGNTNTQICGYFNHSSYNLIKNNYAPHGLGQGKPEDLEIFMDEYPPQDRRVCAQRRVNQNRVVHQIPNDKAKSLYFRARSASGSTVSTSGGISVNGMIPPQCIHCTY